MSFAPFCIATNVFLSVHGVFKSLLICHYSFVPYFFISATLLQGLFFFFFKEFLPGYQVVFDENVFP